MTPFVRKFIQENALPHMPNRVRVLEIGALNINGVVRDLIEPIAERYVGVDLQAGANVDIIADAHDLGALFGVGDFDVVLCLETFEHDSHFWLTLRSIHYALTPGGIFVLTVPKFEFPLHHQPDYWRFGADSIQVLMEGYKILSCAEFEGGIGAVGQLQ